MARIRTFKPDFLKHELLSDLETENPGTYIMLTFMGLWTLCDSQGVFEYRPRQIKLDVLPFIDYNQVEALSLLEKNGFLEVYEIEGKKYGRIASFNEHQRLSGKEATEGAKYPVPACEVANKQGDTKVSQTENKQGSNGEAYVKYPGAQEKEGKGIGKGSEREEHAHAKKSFPQNQNSEKSQVIAPPGQAGLMFTPDNLQTELLKSQMWQVDSARFLKIDVGKMPGLIGSFIDKLKSDGETFVSISDKKKHFSSWAKIQLKNPQITPIQLQRPPKIDHRNRP